MKRQFLKSLMILIFAFGGLGSNLYGQFVGVQTSAEEVKVEKKADKFVLKNTIENFGEVGSVKEVWSNFIIEKSGKYAFVGKFGKTLLPLEYDKIERLFNQFLLIKKENRNGIYDIETKKIIVPLVYDGIEFSQKVGREFIVSKNGKKGILDAEGKEILPPKYDEIKITRLLITLINKGKEEYLFGKDRIVKDSINKEKCFEIRGDYMSDTQYFYAVLKNGKWNILNEKLLATDGEEYEDFEFKDIYTEHKKYYFLLYKKGGKWGLKHFMGKDILPTKYDGLKLVSPSHFVVENKGMKRFYGFLNNQFSNFDFEEYRYGYDNFPFRVQKNGKFFLIDKDYQLIEK